MTTQSLYISKCFKMASVATCRADSLVVMPPDDAGLYRGCTVEHVSVFVSWLDKLIKHFEYQISAYQLSN